MNSGQLLSSLHARQKIVGEAEILYTLEDGELTGRQVRGGKGNG
jgi:hypothetical protein